MRRRGRTRGAGSRYTESTGDLLLADTSPMKLADMAELNIREDVVQTVRAEVKLLQAEIMAEFRATAQSIREDVVKELRSVMSSIQATVADHASAISALETSQGDIADRLEGLERQCVALAERGGGGRDFILYFFFSIITIITILFIHICLLYLPPLHLLVCVQLPYTSQVLNG